MAVPFAFNDLSDTAFAEKSASDSAQSASLSLNHNSDRVVQPDLPFRLTGSQAKTAFALRHNADAMIREAGINCVGFLTLTVGNACLNESRIATNRVKFEQIFDATEASRRINNLNRRVISDLFEKAIVVTERHKSGAIHFHLVGVLRGRPDIRTGFDFEAVKRGDYSSVNATLRGLWAHLRDVLPLYGFGRAELTPIRKTGEAVACYVSKYVEKNLFNRLADDRRKKLVRYIGFERRQLKPNDFGWCSARAAAWRCKARALSALAHVESRDEVAAALGSRWAWRLTRVMRVVDDRPLTFFTWNYPERETARRLVLREVKDSGGGAWLARRRCRDGSKPLGVAPDWVRIEHENFLRERAEMLALN